MVDEDLRVVYEMAEPIILEEHRPGYLPTIFLLTTILSAIQQLYSTRHANLYFKERRFEKVILPSQLHGYHHSFAKKPSRY
ncbi:hypothetical protein KUTeg_023871 [Tegillarca granosa]|uniref:Uncharacterized protein n=1 Tax=Tegillarca granosa TaxID=220873 RepID=A0ABQ9E2Y6_TEGGR|nr:hypothetical protein KUTeg_023871 [Tegillarca granosa]